MKIGIISANYGRLAIFKIFCQGIKRLREETGQRIHCITSGSIDAIDLCKEYDIEFYDYPNRPLTGKFNNSMERMCEKDDVDAIMLMGSDDLISTNTFLTIQKELETHDMVGLGDVYMFGLDGKNIGELYHFRHTTVLGPGRAIKKSIIQSMGHKTWNKDRDRGIDTVMLDSVRDHVKTRTSIKGLHVFDLKSNHNMNGIEFWAKQLPKVNNSILWDNIGKQERELIEEILNDNK